MWWTLGVSSWVILSHRPKFGVRKRTQSLPIGTRLQRAGTLPLSSNRQRSSASSVKHSRRWERDDKPSYWRRAQAYLINFSPRSCGYPRQEPGRNFGFKLVPSAVLFPQRQPKTVFPPTSAEVIGTGAPPTLFSGTRVTTVPLIPVVAAKPCIVTVTLPLTSVPMVDTYFEAPPVDRKSTRLNSSHVEISYAVF